MIPNTIEGIKICWKKINETKENYMYAMKIAEHINSMKQDEVFYIIQNVKSENRDIFLETVCTLLQKRRINIIFNNDFTSFRKQ